MNRALLDQTFRRLAHESGYPLAVVAADRSAQAMAGYPAACMTPATLLSCDGRRHGTALYRVVLRLMRRDEEFTPEGAERSRATIETDLLAIFNRLSCESCVLAVEQLTIRPDAATAPRGEVGMTAEARIVTHF